MWNLTSDRPIYIQLMEVIQRRIITGIYQPGERIPSVRELADEAKVNPNTMQKALSELERSGLIYSQRTNGRFITEDTSMIKEAKISLARDQIESFLNQMKQYGYSATEVADLILHHTTSNQSMKKGE